MPQRGDSAAAEPGIALGGFFDGILLHQNLHWHHLLSRVPGLDLRSHILWDGASYDALYLLALLGIEGVFRAPRSMTRRRLVGALLLGFVARHVADALPSHWLPGLHRIRPQPASPLAWDMALAVADPSRRHRLCAPGALHVTGSPLPAGCLAWSAS